MKKLSLMLVLLLASFGVWAQCMVPPTADPVVSGRFGKKREGGALNFGSANTKPHMHNGLDFSTGGAARPVFATADGVVIYSGARGSAGNAVLIRRPNGQVMYYMHLSAISPRVKKGENVASGQMLGYSGNTPTGSMAVHLHFTYGVPRADQSRAVQFSGNAAAWPNPFKPDSLPNILLNPQVDVGYPTDPSPHFCQSFPIQADGLQSVLGSDTMAQFNALNNGGAVAAGVGGVNPSTAFEATQVAAANADAALAQAAGAPTIASWLSDSDGYGAVPPPPLGDYRTMSPSEMIATEAKRRFIDSHWNQEVARVSSRGLWVDYVRIVGLQVYIQQMIQQKKDRVESLMAVYAAQRAGGQRQRSARAAEAAIRTSNHRSLN